MRELSRSSCALNDSFGYAAVINRQFSGLLVISLADHPSDSGARRPRCLPHLSRKDRWTSTASDRGGLLKASLCHSAGSLQLFVLTKNGGKLRAPIGNMSPTSLQCISHVTRAYLLREQRLPTQTQHVSKVPPTAKSGLKIQWNYFVNYWGQNGGSIANLSAWLLQYNLSSVSSLTAAKATTSNTTQTHSNMLPTR